MNKSDSILKKSPVNSLRMYEARESFVLMGLGIVTGLAAGLAAVLLSWSVSKLEAIHLQFSGEPLIVFFPAIGAALGIFIQRQVLGDKAGHGVADVIKSVTIGKGILSRRMLFSRLISSCLTVGMGGAAGLEGPIVVSGGAAGSAVGSLFNLPERRRILLIACGTSGAIGAIFNAPLTGLVFSLEVILGEWKARNLIPTVTSAAVATQFSRMLIGNKISFPHSLPSTTSMDLPASFFLGILCALLGWAFVKTLASFHGYFQKLKTPLFLTAGLGGLGVGCIGYFQHDSMGEGYHLIHSFILDQTSLGFWTIIMIIILRLVTTSLTLSSGGSGGVFAPSLFFGSALGFLFGGILNRISDPSTFSSAGAFSLIGMAGLVAGVMSAPLTGIFLVFEISGSYHFILPLMLCALTSMLVYRLLEKGSIYTRDLLMEGNLHYRGSGLHILTEIGSDEVMQPCPIMSTNQTLSDYLNTYSDQLPDQVALCDPSNHFSGLVYLEDLKPILMDRSLHSVIFLETMADRKVPLLHQPFRPDEALLLFGETRRQAIPVLDSEGGFTGIVTKTLVLDSIRREMLVQD